MLQILLSRTEKETKSIVCASVMFCIIVGAAPAGTTITGGSGDTATYILETGASLSGSAEAPVCHEGIVDASVFEYA